MKCWLLFFEGCGVVGVVLVLGVGVCYYFMEFVFGLYSCVLGSVCGVLWRRVVR